MNTPKKLLGLFLIILFSTSHSQNEFSKWYFGLQAGLDFATSPPTALINGAVNTIEGVATVCDNNGNLLFYTDGITVYNANHVIMANGSGLFSNSSSTQGVVTIKQPGNSNIYYVFTVYTGTNGASYSVVDMSLAAGLGSVTVLNSPMYNFTCEKQVAVRHCNGRDAWIVSHEFFSNNFRAYLLTDQGLNPTPVISAAGETYTGTTGYRAPAIGHMKISPDGKRLAVATVSNSIPSTLGIGGFHLFDFDAATGIVSNSLTLSNIPLAYGVEFSADGTKLYGVTSPMYNPPVASLMQWDICAGSNAAILASQYTFTLGVIAGSLQRAIDGKIYLGQTGQQNISVINNPNGSGAGMNFSFNAINLSPKMSALGFPNYINTYTKPTPAPFAASLACQTASFAIPPAPSFSSGCSANPYPHSGYLWSFGEPGSGTANTSTLTNPVHTYSTTGTYTVTLVLYSNCTNDTLVQTVNIVNPSPTPSVAGTFTVCKGDKRTYTASGGTSYQWSVNGGNSPTVSLNPTSTTVYTLTATNNGCSASKVFTVNVNSCLGIQNASTNTPLNIYPNPFNQTLSLEISAKTHLMIFDMNGSLLMDRTLEAGSHDISTTELKPGVYSVKAISASGTSFGRVVKVE